MDSENLALLSDAKYLVVGSGFYGSVFAEHIARVLSEPVVVIDKRDHFGGNSYSYADPQTGIEVHKYGTHIFHTSNERVWEYVNRFSKFNSYVHTVKTVSGGKLYSMPINLGTMSARFDRVLNPQTARELIAAKTSAFNNETETESLENFAISQVGVELYESFIKGYTKKQWETDPATLPKEIIKRLPIRYTFNDRYFSDTYEGIPVQGYGALFENLLKSKLITKLSSVDFFDIRHLLNPECVVIYSGPIDQYFAYCEDSLNWRTVDLKLETLELDDFQGCSVINYADEHIPYTRVHEFKHLTPERENIKGTVIATEYSRMAGPSDDPYYPVNLAEDRIKLKRYRDLAKAESRVIFGGRLGSYHYLDMHMAIAAAISDFEGTFLSMQRSQNS